MPADISNGLIRQATLKDLERISEIYIFNYRLNFYPIFKNDDYYFEELTVSNYESILRGIRSSIYQYDLGEVKFLSVLCTQEPDTVKDLVAGFGEHWVVDLNERRLLIYENQVLKFANAKDVIEEALLYQDLSGEKQKEQQKRGSFFFGKHMYLVYHSSKHFNIYISGTKWFSGGPKTYD